MAINEQCARYCIDVIRAVIQEQAVPELPEGLALGELYDFAKHHGVEAMIFHGLEQLTVEEEDPVWQDWCNRADMLLTQSIVQLAERDLLLTELRAAGIPVLPVKGCWLKEQYPQIDYRQMSDLDILIHPEDATAADRVMQGMGYRAEEEGSEHHIGYSKPPYVSVEMHIALLREDNPHHVYYKNLWHRAIPDPQKHLYRLSAEDEYIFYLLHLLNHVLYAGTGIRSFLDCMMYRRLYPGMDRAYLDREFRKLGIRKFAATAERLSDRWFVTGEPAGEELRELENSIFAAGSYGSEAMAEENGIFAFRYPLRFRLGVLLEGVFPGRESMVKRYAVLKKVPVLLPFCWAARLLRIALRSLLGR